MAGARIRVMGIEPTPQAWEAHVLPLNYTRVAATLLPGNLSGGNCKTHKRNCEMHDLHPEGMKKIQEKACRFEGNPVIWGRENAGIA